MYNFSFFCIFSPALFLSAIVIAQSPSAGKNTIMIRGERQDIYFYPAKGQLKHPDSKVLFASGDGGWRGFAVTVAKSVASWGYDVYGLDTKRYLESFTGSSILKAIDVMSDFQRITDWITQKADEKVILMGHSEGAGLCLLAAASNENKKSFSGLVSIGLSKSGVLGGRLLDDITYVTKKMPNEPTFESADFLPKVSPLPILMVQSSHDEYVSVEMARKLFSNAREPKRFLLIESRNHRFDGNADEFFRALHEGMEWIREMSR
ncbi:MAG: alpha/beta hydrolase [Ignavibacteriales bacterium]